MSSPKISVVPTLLLLAACGGSDGGSGSTPTTPPDNTPASISISPSSGNLTFLGATLQLQATVRNSSGSVVSANVSWSSASANIATVSSSGTVSAVAQGTAIITAQAGSASSTATITVSQVATAVAKLAGDGQTANTQTTLPELIRVEVRDQGGSVIEGASVAWLIVSGGGSVQNPTTTTDAQGQASGQWILGETVGEQRLRVEASSSVAAEFMANALDPTVGIPTTLALTSGNNQNGKTLEALALPFVVSVANAQALPVPEVRVNWVITGGDGTLSASSSMTDGSGNAEILYTPGTVLGASTIEARVAGLQGSPVTFSSQTTVLVVRLQGTAIVDPNGNRNQQAVVNVAAGDTIEFVNLDNTVHTATSSANPAAGSPFNSGTLFLNGRFRFVPDAVGVWTVFCQFHPTIMLGATINAS